MERTAASLDKLRLFTNIDFETQSIAPDWQATMIPSEGWIGWALHRSPSPNMVSKQFQVSAENIRNFLNVHVLSLAHMQEATISLKALREHLLEFRQGHPHLQGIERSFALLNQRIDSILSYQNFFHSFKGWGRIATHGQELPQVLLRWFEGASRQDALCLEQACLDQVQSLLDLKVDAVELAACLSASWRLGASIQDLNGLLGHLRKTSNQEEARAFVRLAYGQVETIRDYKKTSQFLSRIFERSGEEARGLIDLWMSGEPELALRIAADPSMIKPFPLLWINSKTAAAAKAVMAGMSLHRIEHFIHRHAQSPEMPLVVKTVLNLSLAGHDELVEQVIIDPDLQRWAAGGEVQILIRWHALPQQERDALRKVCDPVLALQLLDLKAAGLPAAIVDWANKHHMEGPAMQRIGSLRYLWATEPDQLKWLYREEPLLDAQLDNRLCRMMERHLAQHKVHSAAGAFARTAARILVADCAGLNIGIISHLRNHAYLSHLSSENETGRHIQWMLAAFEQSPEIAAALSQVPAPRNQHSTASKLIRSDLGLHPSQTVTKLHAQQAVVMALLSPLRQGRTGSCFGTGPLIAKFSSLDGIFEIIEDLAEGIGSDAFTRELGSVTHRFFLQAPAGGPKERRDNVLLRSYEGAYSSLAGPGEYGALPAIADRLLHEKGVIRRELISARKDLSLTDQQKNQFFSMLMSNVKSAIMIQFTARYLPNMACNDSDKYGAWQLEAFDPWTHSGRLGKPYIALISAGFHTLETQLSFDPELVKTIVQWKNRTIERLINNEPGKIILESGGLDGLVLAHDRGDTVPVISFRSSPASPEELLATQLQWIHHLPQRDKDAVQANRRFRLCISYENSHEGHALTLMPSKDARVGRAMTHSKEAIIKEWKGRTQTTWKNTIKGKQRRALMDSLKKLVSQSEYEAIGSDWKSAEDLYKLFLPPKGKRAAEALIQQAVVKAKLIQPISTMDTNWTHQERNIYAGFVFQPYTKEVSLVLHTEDGDLFRRASGWVGDGVVWSYIGNSCARSHRAR